MSRNLFERYIDMSDLDPELIGDSALREAALGRRSLLKGAGLTAGAAALLAACGKSSKASSGGGAGNFVSTPKYKFVFVNHVTTNPFFQATQYGIQDACALLNCTYQWTGSETSDVTQMVTAMNTAITGNADGIAVALIDTTAFNGPTKTAMAAGIPVLSYNADVPPTAGSPTSARTCTPPARRWASRSQLPCRPIPRSRSSSPRPARSTSSPGPTAQRPPSRPPTRASRSRRSRLAPRSTLSRPRSTPSTRATRT